MATENKHHDFFMKRCLQLAMNGLGATYPNPLVGCVIVHCGKIIGEGWHKKAGEGHAEVNAINSVKNKELLSESTLYVNLEPCSHFGKTPPCASLIVECKIKRVIVGTIDSSEKVSGRGIELLKQSGIEVVVGILEDECKEINKRFFKFNFEKRPYIILKWAETKNGFLAPIIQKKGQPFWITNEVSKQLVHKWRGEEMAILVGKNTVLIDNPRLTTRSWQGKNPLRVIIDKNLEIDDSFQVYNQETETIFITNENKESIENISFEISESFNKLPQSVCNIMYQKNIQSIIIEGGATILNQFIEVNLWDEARVFVGDIFFEEGIKAPHISENPIKKEKIGEDILFYFRNNLRK